jgi:hypothetical protein
LDRELSSGVVKINTAKKEEEEEEEEEEEDLRPALRSPSLT